VWAYGPGMITKLVPVGRAKGVRLPAALVRDCGFEEKVSLSVSRGAVVIRPHRKARAGWSAAFREMRNHGDDVLLDSETGTAFDRSEWRWQ
jgi:antitoxin MazE